jgi:hypothetical protein
MNIIAEIGGSKYYPLLTFANLTCRSVAAIRHLMFEGNRIRKLKYIEESKGKYYIPVEEYTEFPFTSSGRYSADKIYHYTPTGEYVLEGKE